MSDKRKSKKGKRKEEWDYTRSTPVDRYHTLDEGESEKVRIRGRRRWVAIGVVIVSYLFLYMKLNWPSTIFDIPEIAARLYAKEFCSCTFVMRQSYKECRSAFGQFIPAFYVDINPDTKVVDTQVLWVSGRAIYQNDRVGCMTSAP